MRVCLAAALLVACSSKPVAEGGGCTIGCPTGSVCSAGACLPLGCASGGACPSGLSCVGGYCVDTSCVPPCQPAQACLDEICLAEPPPSCGSASDCPSGESCVAGYCTESGCAPPCESGESCLDEICVPPQGNTACAPPYTACTSGAGAYCANLDRDSSNCGACGDVCPAGQVCNGSGACAVSCISTEVKCAAPPPQNFACADVSSDQENCGACGNACAAGERCSSGTCAATCSAPSLTCGQGATAYCATPGQDPQNCGACGNVCPPGGECVGGACEGPCPAPYTRCSATCADTRYDPSNCGGCGQACAAGQLCNLGACVQSAGTSGGGGSSGGTVGGGTGGLRAACFSPVELYAATSPNSIAVGDLDGDGIQDIVVTDGVGYVGVLFGNGFRGETTYAVGSAPDGVAIGALENDGVNDLVVANCGGESVSVLLNDGGGGFGPAESYATDANSTTAVALGDFNGDGWLDIAATTWNNDNPGTTGLGGVSVFLNQKNGSFASQAFYPSSYSGDALMGIAVADFNLDGWLDIVVTGESARGNLFFNAGTGAGTFSAGAPAFGAGSFSSGVAAGVLTGGVPDIVTTAPGQGAILALLGYATGFPTDGGYLSKGTYPLTGTASEYAVSGVALADVNGDGTLDAIAADEQDGTIVVALNDGGGVFSAIQTFTVGGANTASGCVSPSMDMRVATGDFNGDGKVDVAVSLSSINEVGILLNCTP